VSATDETITGTPEFPIAWQTDWDPEVSWEWDDMHMPVVLTPLAGDYTLLIAGGFNQFYETFDLPQRMYGRVWNGYVYFGMRRGYPMEQRQAMLDRFTAVLRDRMHVCAAFWNDEVLPEILDLEAEIRAIPVESLPLDELSEAWVRAWAAGARMWQLHFNLVHIPYQVIEDLADLYEGLFPDAPKGEAAAMSAGTHSELVDVDLGMERLAAIAARHAALRDLLVASATGGPDERRVLQVADLEGVEGAPELLTELDSFLLRHGHLGQGMDDLGMPSWAEEPAMVLANVGTRLAAPPEAPEDRRRRLEAEAERLAARTRERLADDPEKLATFEVLYGLARSVAPLTETHNYWIDRMAQARLRTFVLRVADRLVGAGVIEDRSDIFLLSRDEVRAVLAEPGDRRALIAERRAQHAHNATLKPLPNVGAPPPAPIADRFDTERKPNTEPDLLQGTGASAGVVRGPARVALGPGDFARIQPGDIIVCPSSNPSWVPVFTIAGGLVTNTGGVLSHAAVVAREFGLPAVVGTTDATKRIADGRLVEIDGTKGSVRLL
jgi:phosphohistidine swiveling domain-containing protein